MKVQLLLLVLLVSSSFSMKVKQDYFAYMMDGEHTEALSNHLTNLETKIHSVSDLLSGDVSQLEDELWATANSDGNEYLNKDEFYAAIVGVSLQMNEEIPTAEEAVQIYYYLDQNGDDRLDKGEFTQGFREHTVGSLINYASEQWWTQLFLGDVQIPETPELDAEGTYENDLYERSWQAADAQWTLSETLMNPNRLRQIFEDAVFWNDLDGSETINQEEFYDVVQEICTKFQWEVPSNEDVDYFFQMSDTDGSGDLDYKELEAIAVNSLQPEVVNSLVEVTRNNQELNAEIFNFWMVQYPEEVENWDEEGSENWDEEDVKMLVKKTMNIHKGKSQALLKKHQRTPEDPKPKQPKSKKPRHLKH